MKVKQVLKQLLQTWIPTCCSTEMKICIWTYQTQIFYFTLRDIVIFVVFMYVAYIRYWWTCLNANEELVVPGDSVKKTYLLKNCGLTAFILSHDNQFENNFKINFIALYACGFWTFWLWVLFQQQVTYDWSTWNVFILQVPRHNKTNIYSKRLYMISDKFISIKDLCRDANGFQKIYCPRMYLKNDWYGDQT